MVKLLGRVLGLLDRIIPFKGGRTAIVIVGGLIYTVIQWQGETIGATDAVEKIVYVLGLGFAALHKN